MKWLKRGLIFKTDRQFIWMNSHAQCPTAIELEDSIRIFFSARLVNQESLPTFIDVEKGNPQNILVLNSTPVLERGRRGTFDENGIIPNYFIFKGNRLYFYYAGWSQCKNVPYKNFTGLAISDDKGLSFEKYSEAPVFTLNEFDPFSATGPCIIKKNNQFVAIYSTGIDWLEIMGKLEHTYSLTYAVSKDAIHWYPSGKLIIKPSNEFEANCKPTIIEKDNVYHMWFSTRGSLNFRSSGSTSYRIGYAFSTDLINWTRDDAKAGITISETGWDSEMICYPHIINVGKKYLMFYNGNGFGASGFGYAELEIN
ncbi:MAG: hypothetical protein EPN88_09370 [Bacteroidetes bacterium]|nr:MAG: hypothetical protein EPN88_09370 [Bacteroidota bacterium]